MLSLEGKQLGNYDVTRRIRIGGMGAVYEGRQRTAFGRRVAIKVILGDYAADRDMRRRFAREARTVARLHHPHILPLIEFGEAQSVLYLVMPFIEGGTLTSYLRRSLPDLSEVTVMYQQLLDAVEYAHEQGLIHRDIKSSNVLLEMSRSGAPYVYLADFGLVRTSRQAELEQTGKPIPLDQVPGTPQYMAPEQTRGVITASTDIYALGVLLYQMLTGELPYKDDNDVRTIEMHLYDPIPVPSDHDASIPTQLDDVVRNAMAKRMEDRFQSVAELRAAFLNAIHGPTTMQEEEFPLEQIVPSPSPLPAKRSVPLQPQTLSSKHSLALPPQVEPVPLAVPHRVRQLPLVTQVREQQERQRITDTVKNNQRITDEPVKPLKGKRGHLNVPLIVSTLMPTILLLLLIMPRVLGVSFFPSGFPLFGTPPVATIFITVQEKVVQDKYVLTASPQTTSPNLATHSIPDRLLQSNASDMRTVQTTGSKSVEATQAHGIVVFSNRSNTPFPVEPLVITTSGGIRIQITQEVNVPPRQNGQDGTASASAIAVNPGVSGNIPAHALDGVCCNSEVSARNPDAFAGGAEAQTIKVVSQTDIDEVQKALTPKLQQQVEQQLQKQVSSDETIAGDPIYKTSVSASSPVGTQADQVQVLVGVSGSTPVYNRSVVNSMVSQLLSKQAEQALGDTYHVQGVPTVAMPHVVQQGKDGLVYLNVSARGIWIYSLSTQQMNQWRQSIKGASLAAANAYLNTREGVTAVQVHLPFGTDHVPSSIDEIKIILLDDSTTS